MLLHPASLPPRPGCRHGSSRRSSPRPHRRHRSRAPRPPPSRSLRAPSSVTPSPYGRQRPCRQRMRSGSASTCRRSSRTSRLLPMPGSPTSVISCHDRHPVGSARRLGRSSSSSRCPTDEGSGGRLGDVEAEARAGHQRLPRRDGLGLALGDDTRSPGGSRSSSRVARWVVSSTRTLSTGRRRPGAARRCSRRRRRPCPRRGPAGRRARRAPHRW